MTSQYQIPLHFCQWCYKSTGRFIVDCLCLVCQPCLKSKKDWIDEKNNCFNCNKHTSRKFIDLKNNPQQGGFYFQNTNNSFKNILRIQQFQQQVTKKYCKHLEIKVNKLQTIIRTFVSQFPQYGQFFQNIFRQLQNKQNSNIRSKSAESQITQNQNNKIMYQNNTERNISMKQQSKGQTPIYQSNSYIQNNNNQRNVNNPANNPQQYQKKQKKFSVTSKISSQASLQDEFNQNIYQPQMKIPANKKKPMMDSVAKVNTRKQPSKILINPNYDRRGIVQSNQGYQLNQISPVYVVGGSRKLSDPSKQQLNLNNLNIQTALRSIRSQDERVFPPFQTNNQDPRQMNNMLNHQDMNQQFMNQNNADNNNRQNHSMLQRFGRKSK